MVLSGNGKKAGGVPSAVSPEDCKLQQGRGLGHLHDCISGTNHGAGLLVSTQGTSVD